MTKFAPQYGFSVASLFADARNVNDFSEEGFTGLYGDRMSIIVPNPTPQDRRERGMPMRVGWRETDQASEWEDSFFPMMNALWPVELAYGRDEDEAAALMNQHAGATSLISIDDQTYIAMTGGGMNLSWHIAAAYVCCGCVPPLDILDGLSRSPFETSKQAKAAIMRAWREGVAHMKAKAKRMGDDRRAYLAKARG